MRKSQLILVIAASAAVILLYAFGRTKVDTKPAAPPAAAAAGGMSSGNVQAAAFPDLLQQAKTTLTPERIAQLSILENSVVRGDVKVQQIQAYRHLSAIWDSIGNRDMAAHYSGEAAKLENSEKSLTFAANLFLNQLQHTADPVIRKWESDEAAELLQQALKLNPDNDTVQVALAGSYVEGGDIMKGVQQLLAVTQKDSNNVGANLMLGRLSIQSGQYEKAIARLQKVVAAQPENTEALYFLAVSCRETGDNKQAVQYFERCKQLVNNPEFDREIDSLINTMK